MNAYAKEYAQKHVSAEQAVKVVKSGDWLDYGLAIAMPNALDQALAARASELEDVMIRNVLSMHPPAVMAANQKENRAVFTYNSWYYGGHDRTSAKGGSTYHIPMRFSDLPMLYQNDIENIDVALLIVTPMDKFGYFNFGPSAASAMAVCRKAKTVIVEVNPNLPRSLGKYDECIHISEVDFIVEDDAPIPTMVTKPPNETDRKIAELIMEEIPQQACLQLGIGSMPNAGGMLLAESDLKDLGIHTEMYVDSMMELTNRGKISGRCKKTDPGKQVYAFAAGSTELYEFIDDNPQLMTAPVDYVNDPFIIAQNDRFISINNAVEVDLLGQVNAESMTGRQISGTGGQLDFVLGASHAREGKSFICLSSTFTDKAGQVHSRIVPAIQTGSIVTDPRTAVHWVVTEFGKVNLRGKSTWERAEALISISHPDFRDALTRDAENYGIWLKKNR